MSIYQSRASGQKSYCLFSCHLSEKSSNQVEVSVPQGLSMLSARGPCMDVLILKLSKCLVTKLVLVFQGRQVEKALKNLPHVVFLAMFAMDNMRLNKNAKICQRFFVPAK